MQILSQTNFRAAWSFSNTGGIQWNSVNLAIALARVISIPVHAEIRRDVFKDVILKKACEESFLRIARNIEWLFVLWNLVQTMRIYLWEIAGSIVFHKSHNTSKEQVQRNFVKNTGSVLKLKNGATLSGVMDTFSNL